LKGRNRCVAGAQDSILNARTDWVRLFVLVRRPSSVGHQLSLAGVARATV